MKRILGFTLVEMLVVLTVIAIIMPTTMMILYNILAQQAKINKLVATRREGEAAMTFIKERIMRDADSIWTTATGNAEICPYNIVANGNDNDIYQFYFNDIKSTASSKYRFSFKQSTATGPINYIEYSPVAPLVTSVALTSSSKFLISSFKLICNHYPTSQKSLIYISFTIKYNDEYAAVASKKTELYYSSRFMMRN